MSQVWTAFEHRIWKVFCEHGIEKSERCILAVSGGLDSMVLLQLFRRLCPQMKLTVAYYHHGLSADSPDIQTQYRSSAQKFITDVVTSMNAESITLATGMSPIELKSEQEMRTARWDFLKGLRRKNEVIATGHHQDDHLETILLKLIRGTSADGVGGFIVWNGDVFRPLLNETKVELLRYARERGVKYLEDPSNSEDKYLRNWLRNRWLPDLESRVPGGTANLAQSLFKITAAAAERPGLAHIFDSQDEPRIDRNWWLTLSRAEQLRVLAIFLKKHQIYSFTSGHLEEIHKRLDKNQKDITFELLGRKWVINASQIMLQ